MASLITKPSLIEAGNMKFLIIDAPREQNLHLYLKEFKKYNVKHLVRIDVTPPGYSGEDVEKAGITMHEMFFDDGASPPKEVIAQWRAVVASTFDHASADNSDLPCIAVHCIAGLGRAPVLVAIAMVEHGIDAISAVTLIRSKRSESVVFSSSYVPNMFFSVMNNSLASIPLNSYRRGAINAVQLNYLESYKPERSAKKKCTIM